MSEKEIEYQDNKGYTVSSDLPKICRACGLHLIAQFKESEVGYNTQTGHKWKKDSYAYQCPQATWIGKYIFQMQHIFHKYVKTVTYIIEEPTPRDVIVRTVEYNLKKGISKEKIIDFILDKYDNNLDAVHLIDELGLK